MLAPWHRRASITYQADRHGVTAYDGHIVVGYLTWWDPALITAAISMGVKPNPMPWELQRIEVRPEYQRRGIASAMFEVARDHHPTVRFSRSMTDEGAAWAASLGYTPSGYVRVPEAEGRIW